MNGNNHFSFFTPVDMPHSLPRLAQAQRLMALGSCFATEMGGRLAAAKFQCDVNPFGVLYNPLSIATALRQIADGQPYAADDLFFANGCWNSAMHHSSFSMPTVEETLKAINNRLQQAHAGWNRLDALLLTLGTAWVYCDRETDRVVGNCHKRPERYFRRTMLTVDEIVEALSDVLDSYWTATPSMQVLFTVSPIRHIRDGLHANQLSKATLLLAVEQLQQRYPDRVAYFPAYELLLDELRDYRFYATDMVHPSEMAVEVVWDRFVQACFTPEAMALNLEIQEIAKALQHKPFRPESEAYKHFLGQIVLKIDRLNEKYPYLDFQNERELCRIRLKASQK